MKRTIEVLWLTILFAVFIVWLVACCTAHGQPVTNVFTREHVTNVETQWESVAIVQFHGGGWCYLMRGMAVTNWTCPERTNGQYLPPMIGRINGKFIGEKYGPTNLVQPTIIVTNLGGMTWTPGGSYYITNAILDRVLVTNVGGPIIPPPPLPRIPSWEKP